jgi:hypothetical protein
MTKSGAPGEERSSSGGFGVAAGMIAAALVALWAPTYLGWSGWSETAWHVAGGILGTIGMGGGLLELSQLQGRRGYDDWGVGAVFIGQLESFSPSRPPQAWEEPRARACDY